MVFKCLLTWLFLFPLVVSASLDEACLNEAVLKMTKDPAYKEQASDFLKLQGDITLHRMAWAYLKAQSADETQRLENVERTILSLLDDKYTSTDPKFIKARDEFEAQPLSRTALADIAPYLKDVLLHEFEEGSEAFILNASDLKLLHSLSKFEKQNAKDGDYDHRMLARKSPEGMLNFAKLINSSYKVTPSSEEIDIGVDMRLQGMEKTISNLQKKLKDFVKGSNIIQSCLKEIKCDLPESEVAELTKQNEDIQDVFLELLTEQLSSDDLLLNNLTYGEIWLRTGKEIPDSKPSLAKVKNPSVIQTHQVQTEEPQAIKPLEKNKATKPIPEIVAQETTPSFPALTSSPISNPWTDYNKQQKQPVTTTKIGNKVIQSQTSSVNGFYKSSTGMIIEDPIGVIIRDRAGRSRKAWESFDKEFIGKMADTILNDDKVFEINGKVFSRETGKSLTHAEAYKLVSNKTAQTAKQRIAVLTDKNMEAKLLVAIINQDQAFEHGGKLYSRWGEPLGKPELIIAQQMTDITRKPVLPKTYKGMDNGYLVARATAMMNKKPHFRSGNTIHDTLTGRNVSSPFRSLAKVQVQSFEKEKKVQYQNLSDRETIINYHADKVNKTGCQYYSIVDKKKAILTLYKLSGEKVLEREVLVGVKASDERTKWTDYDDSQHLGSYTTGAGAFKIGQPKKGAYYEKNYSNNILQIQGQNVFAIHQVPNQLQSRYRKFGTSDPADRRVSQGCVNMKAQDLVLLSKYMQPSCNLYVLPEEKTNKFVVKDDRLEFLPTAPSSRPKEYNYTANKAAYKPIKISFKAGANDVGQNKMAKNFLATLEKEKSKLMTELSLSNDEYNELALVSFALMGNETSFGTHPKLWAKEYLQFAVRTVKGAKYMAQNMTLSAGPEVYNNSRGYTQIKNLPEGSWRKAYPEINKSNLDNSRNAAIATMAYLASTMRTVRNIAADNKSDPKKVQITKERVVEYLGYLYQGKYKALTNDINPRNPVNPVKNTYVQNLKRNMDLINLVQKIE